MEKMGEGREGDWECGGCKNRNYAFRSFCNRCKQPRLLVDTKTPPNSKWLPRIGDWICTGCTNNNYASREKCQKCGQPKEVAAIPAIAIPGATFPAYSHYFSRAPGGNDQKFNFGLLGNGVLPEPLSGIQVPAFAYLNSTSQPLAIPKGWRNGDWICRCGFHNYSSRTQCKSCNASMPPAIGTKRLAPEELAQDLDNKRLNSGNTNCEQETKPGSNQMAGITTEAGHGGYTPFSGIGSGLVPNWQAPIQFPLQLAAPALLGKGAKQWRAGDWMCTKCNNHNYASREECNRCKAQKDIITQPVCQPIDTA